MQDQFIGEISLLSFDWAPRAWHLCDGATLQVSQYQALFSLIGYTYGGSNQTFMLPDLRSRAVVSQGTLTGLPYLAIGTKAGNISSYTNAVGTTTIVSANLPSHKHSLGIEAIATTNVSVGTMNTAASQHSPDGNTLTAQNVNSYASIPSSGPTGAMGGVAATTNLSGTTGTINSTTQQSSISIPFTSNQFSIMQPFLVMNYCIALFGLYPSRP